MLVRSLTRPPATAELHGQGSHWKVCALLCCRHSARYKLERTWAWRKEGRWGGSGGWKESRQLTGSFRIWLLGNFSAVQEQSCASGRSLLQEEGSVCGWEYQPISAWSALKPWITSASQFRSSLCPQPFPQSPARHSLSPSQGIQPLFSTWGRLERARPGESVRPGTRLLDRPPSWKHAFELDMLEPWFPHL